MFDLEQSIAEWREQMLAAGIQSPAPLEELESHLREEIARQMKSGSTSPQAFEIAVEGVGPGTELKREFKKVGEPLGARLVKLAGIACFAAAFLFSLWIVFVLFFIRETDWPAKLSGVVLLGISVLSWRYNYKCLPVVPISSLRTALGFACCLGCLWWIHFFIQNNMPPLVVYSLERGMAGDEALDAFLGGWIVMAILAGIGHGLDKAARRHSATAVL